MEDALVDWDDACDPDGHTALLAEHGLTPEEVEFVLHDPNASRSAGARIMTPELEERFDLAMMDVYRRAKTEAHYIATRYFQMLTQHRGVETARILLHDDTVSEADTALWERGRLDLTVEALIHGRAEYQALFTAEELATARKRLADYKYAIVDPIEQFIGAFPTDTPRWADEHDKYLGQTQLETMNQGNSKRS